MEFISTGIGLSLGACIVFVPLFTFLGWMKPKGKTQNELNEELLICWKERNALHLREVEALGSIEDAIRDR